MFDHLYMVEVCDYLMPLICELDSFSWTKHGEFFLILNDGETQSKDTMLNCVTISSKSLRD